MQREREREVEINWNALDRRRQTQRICERVWFAAPVGGQKLISLWHAAANDSGTEITEFNLL